MITTGAIEFKEISPYEKIRDHMNAATRARYSLYKLNDGSDEYKALQTAYDRYIAAIARKLAALADTEAEVMK